MTNLVRLFEHELNDWDWLNTYVGDFTATKLMCMDVCPNAWSEEVERLQVCIDEMHELWTPELGNDARDLFKSIIMNDVVECTSIESLDFKIKYYSSRLSNVLKEITQELIDLRS